MRAGPLVGVLGGGQLGRMIALAGVPLGVRFRFLDADRGACAAPFGEHVCGEFTDPQAIARLCDGIDAATLEFENVPSVAAEAVAALAPLRPGARSLEVAQDRLFEKNFVRECGARTTACAPVDDAGSLDDAIAAIGLPAVLKTRRLGYDGKGQVLLREPGDRGAAAELASHAPCLLEAFVPFERELSVVVVRAEDGSTAAYPATENLHAGGILRASRAPAAGDASRLLEAERVAVAVAERLGHVGAMCVEFFEVDGVLLVNEIAPRVHNSGHWTIDAAGCSQFENHLRAVLGWPLGPVGAPRPCVMLNFIGSAPTAVELLAQDPGAHVHLYGKAPREGRKVGHVTLADESRASLSARVQRLAGLAGVDSESARRAAERASVS